MHVIGLTGGIATGKTTVSTYLKQKNIPIIDCDILAREAVRPSKPAFDEVVAFFGQEILDENGTINRQYLGEIVFNDANKRLQLEKIVHKQVIDDIKKELSEYSNNEERIVVVDIPLLYEAKLEYLVDEVWVVVCSAEQQLQRLQKRNNFTEAEAQVRIDSQMSLELKAERADFVLENNTTIENLYHQIDQRLQQLEIKMR